MRELQEIPGGREATHRGKRATLRGGRKQWTSSHRPSESSDPLSWPGMSSSLIEGRGLIATGGQRKGQEFIRGLEPKGYNWKGGRKRMKPTRKPAPASWGRTAIAVWLRAFSSTYHGMDEGSGIAGSYNFIKSGDGVRLREIGKSISEAPSPFGFVNTEKRRAVWHSLEKAILRSFRHGVGNRSARTLLCNQNLWQRVLRLKKTWITFTREIIKALSIWGGCC